jgi:preprotein translocase subunit SecY
MNVVLPQYRDLWHGLVCVCIMTAGTVFLMWIGEQIDEFGIGNGISLLIMAGILARVPVALKGLWENSTSKLTPEPGKYGIITLLLLLGLFIAVVVGVIAITESQRRIPTQSAKHVRGRRVFGGTRQYLPLKVNQAGVMPIIFASSLLIFPSIVFKSLANMTVGFRSEEWTFGSFFANTFQELADAFTRQSFIYTVCYIILIYFFCYFWTAITFNPKDMADNLKNFGSFIPGYRPGKRTSDYLEKVMLRITYVGAAFLSLVAVIPSIVQSALDVDFTVASFLGGTGLLIVISVCLDLVQKIDSHLVMRSYSGLVDKK